MRGIIKFVDPDKVEMSLTVTATVKEWREVREALAGSTSGAADILHRQIGDLLKDADGALAQNSWTTGYARGVEEKER